ncbi:N-6 DNA methylase [Clostridium kluyveri]|uniref:site-specific DNA-methyltransferase (adenine-specific) n=1 Tax=Clostridium kluyveri TaxID=1534 RepID=A0A1L5FEB7_CLOKL|nr:N-6 DNA methylase [Clostridium kluyveri]APM41351.1 hypothetical protein BS101_21820 [Clostridium kluyveri]
MSMEADTRIHIDKWLENLGWNLEGKDKNVFLEQPRSETERKKLKGKRPDYVLYSQRRDKPIMVIEAKRKGERVDRALEQGVGYAKLLGAPIVFATDGLFCKSYHTKFDKSLLLNGEEVDEFLRELLAIQYLNTYEVNTISPKVQYSRQELIKIFNDANNMLRGEGLRAGIERFGEFANILFLKLISENEENKELEGEEAILEASFRWKYIRELSTTDRIDYINNMVYPKINKLYGGDNIFDKLAIRNPKTLSQIIDKIDPLTLTDINSDVKGDAFEYFLKESTASGNDLGEYFTPRHIVKTMVRLANPKIGEKVYDPFCGTGGLLIESFRHIWNTMPRNDTTKKILTEKTIYGNEITNTARITKMNMILAGDGHSNIKMEDSLANPVDGRYDVVLTNMPYSQKTDYADLYDVKSNNGDSICVQHCMKSINKTANDGRMVIVVPEGFLFRKDLAKTREYMLNNCELQSIISLPQGVFLPYTGVKTNILYATKVNKKHVKKRSSYWYFEVKNDGYTLDNHRRKIEGDNDLKRYEEYRKLDIDQKEEMINVGFDIISLERIKKNSYILVGNRYKDTNIQRHSYYNVMLKDIVEIIAGQSPEGKYYNQNNEGMPFYQGNSNFGYMYINPPIKWTTQVIKKAVPNDILLSVRAPVGKINICMHDICIGRGLMALRAYNNINYKFLYYIMLGLESHLNEISSGSTFKGITKEQISKLVIPLYSLDKQQKIVCELDSYQNIIINAKRIMDSYKPYANIDKYNKIKLKDLCILIQRGKTPKYGESNIQLIKSGQARGFFDFDFNKKYYVSDDFKIDHRLLKKGDVLLNSTGVGTAGRVTYFELDGDCLVDGHITILRPDKDKINPKYLMYALSIFYGFDKIEHMASGSSGKIELNLSVVKDIEIPVPDLNIQNRIVDGLENERKIIINQKNAINLFTNKINNRVDELFY